MSERCSGTFFEWINKSYRYSGLYRLLILLQAIRNAPYVLKTVEFLIIVVNHIPPSIQWNYQFDNQQRPTTSYASNSNFNIRRFSSYYNDPPPHSSCQCIKLRNCAQYVEVIRMSSPTSRSLLESLRSKICGYDGSDVKVCCPFDQRRRRDSFRFDATTEEPWVWDVEETTTTVPSHHHHHHINLNNRFDENSENSDFHNFLQPTKTEFGDVDSTFNEFHHFKRKPPKPFRKHEILFHFEDPATYKNCPPAISTEFELPDDFKHVVPPIVNTAPPPVIPVTTPQALDENGNENANRVLSREEKMKLINTEFCGISVNTRIIGGEDAGPGQFPWMARLAYRNKSKFLSFFKLFLACIHRRVTH